MCDNQTCECTYCKGDNYDRYISDMLRENLDNIERFFIKRLNRDDYNNEEAYYTEIMLQAQKELFKGNKIELEKIYDKKSN